MLLNPQERHTSFFRVSLHSLRGEGVCSLVDLSDDDQPAARLQDSQDFAQIGRQIRPPEVCLDGRDGIKRAVRKWHPGDGRFPNLNTRDIDPLPVRSRGRCHARLRMIDAIDLALSGDRSQLTYRSASTAAHVEDDVLLPWRSMRQTPICHPGMPGIHIPQDESSEPSSRVLALSHNGFGFSGADAHVGPFEPWTNLT
jgi:hypothetical protein